MELFSYLIKSAAILGLFYLVYWFALRKHTLFIANRQYLLSGVAAALILPLFQFTQTVYLPAPVVERSIATPLEMVAVENTIPLEQTGSIDWLLLLLGVYALGVLIGLLHFIYHSWALLRVLKVGNYQKSKGYYHVKTDQDLAPFSFFKYLVYNPQLHSQEELEMIIQHEKAHAKGWHSLDMLLGNLLTIIHWLNPLAWWYKKSMVQNLEFIADQQTVREIPSKKAYQLALVKASTQGQHLQLSNSFYQSFIKNRIVMLNTNQSQKTKRWRLLLILPLLALFMYSFNINKEIAYLDNDDNAKATTIAPSFLIDKFSTKADLLEIEDYYTKNHDEVLLDFSNETWKDGKLTTYQLSIEFPGSESGGGKLIDENTETEIIPRVISYKQGPAINIEHLKDRKDYMIIDYNGLSYFNPEEDLKMDQLRGATYDRSTSTKGTATTIGSGVAKGSDAQATTIVSEGEEDPDYLFIINEKPWAKESLPKGKKIVTDGHIEMLEPEEGIANYGRTGKDGVLVVHGYAKFEENTPEIASTASLKSTGDITLLITADMSKAELNEKLQYLNTQHDISIEIKDIAFKEGKIIALALEYNNGNNSGRYSVSNDGKPIDDVVLSFDDDGGMMAGNVNSEARMAQRIAQMEARKAQLEARKVAREGEMKARKLARESEMKARRAELAAMKAEMASMSEEQKAEMKVAMQARRAEMAAMSSAQKAKMNAQLAEMKARENAVIANQRAAAYSNSATGYARATSGAVAQGVAATIAADVYIDKNTTDADLEQIKKELAAENVSFTYKRVKRNSRGEITGIRISIDNNKGSKSSTNIKSSDDKPIDTIHLEY